MEATVLIICSDIREMRGFTQTHQLKANINVKVRLLSKLKKSLLTNDKKNH